MLEYKNIADRIEKEILSYPFGETETLIFNDIDDYIESFARKWKIDEKYLESFKLLLITSEILSQLYIDFHKENEMLPNRRDILSELNIKLTLGYLVNAMSLMIESDRENFLDEMLEFYDKLRSMKLQSVEAIGSD